MSVNKVILIGNVGDDPKIHFFEKTNTTIAMFSIATSERAFKTKEGKEIPERTEWHNIVARGGLVSVIEGWVKKGTQLYIEGKIRTRSWDSKEGAKRYTTEVYVDKLDLLGKKPQSNGNGQGADSTPPPSENEDLPF